MFQTEDTLGRSAFIEEIKCAFHSFSKIVTAEFQVTAIHASSSPPNTTSAKAIELQTNIRYELVATGLDFYREQRVGDWQILWERAASGELRVKNWKSLTETQSHNIGPAYVDISDATIGGNQSYSAQLLHGVRLISTDRRVADVDV